MTKKTTVSLEEAFTIGLVGCCKAKLAHAAPARAFYVSRLFQLSLEVAMKRCDVVYVISAEHALVPLDHVLAPYDKTMKDLAKEWRPIWGSRVWDAIARRHPDVSRHIVIYAGKEYAEPILRAAPYGGRGATFEQPLVRMQIGQRLQHLTAASKVIHSRRRR